MTRTEQRTRSGSEYRLCSRLWPCFLSLFSECIDNNCIMRSRLTARCSFPAAVCCCRKRCNSPSSCSIIIRIDEPEASSATEALLCLLTPVVLLFRRVLLLFLRFMHDILKLSSRKNWLKYRSISSVIVRTRLVHSFLIGYIDYALSALQY